MQSLQISFNENLYPNDAQAEDLIKQAGHFLNELANCAKPNRARDFAEKLADIDSPELMKQQVGIYIGLGKLKAKRSYSSIWKSYKESDRNKKLSTEWTIQGNNDPCLKALTNLQKALEQLIQHTTITLLLNDLKSGSTDTKKKAAQTFGELGIATDPVLDSLAQALGDKEHHVRFRAHNTLVALAQKDDNVKARIVELLLNILRTGSADAKRKAAQTFGELGIATDPVLDELIKALESKVSIMRYEAHDALVALVEKDETNKQRVVKRVIPVLTAVDADMRQEAVKTIKDLGVASDPVLDGLVRALGDKDYYVRLAASDALVALAKKDDKIRQRVMQQVTPVLTSNNKIAKDWAAITLGYLGVASDPVLDTLVQALKENKNFYPRRDAERALAALTAKDEETKQIVAARIITVLVNNDYNSLSKEWAANLLKSLGVTSDLALAGLTQALGSDVYYVEGAADRALVALSEKDETVKMRVVELLLDVLLKTGNRNARTNAAEILGKLGVVSEPVLEGLVQALEDKENVVRSHARFALVALAQKNSETKQKIVSLLLPLLQQKNKNNDTEKAVKKILLALGIDADKTLNDAPKHLLISFSSILQSLATSEDKIIIDNDNKKPLMNSPILTFSTQQTHEKIADSTMINDDGDNELNAYQNQPSQINSIE